MCSPQQVKDQIYQAFEEAGGMKDQMQEQTVSDMNALIVKVMTGVGVTFIVSMVTFALFLNNMQNRVATLQNFVESGEVFTQADARILMIQIEANQSAVKESASTAEVKELKEAFIRLDERLRNKGI